MNNYKYLHVYLLYYTYMYILIQIENYSLCLFRTIYKI